MIFSFMKAWNIFIRRYEQILGEEEMFYKVKVSVLRQQLTPLYHSIANHAKDQGFKEAKS